MIVREFVKNLDGTEEIKEREETQKEIEEREKSERETKRRERIAEINERLSYLSQDFVQVSCGEIIDDISERKTEFVTLHNELRELLGKEKRRIKEE